MTTTPEDLPDDIAALQAALLAERERAARVEAELAVAKAKASDDQALIAHQRLQIAKLTRELYGQRSERRAQLLEQRGYQVFYVRRSRETLYVVEGITHHGTGDQRRGHRRITARLPLA